MKKLPTLVLFVVIISQFTLTAQDGIDSIQGIIRKKNKYFNIQREVIHLHLNKTTYTSDEEIWFKAYIVDNLDKKPFDTTTNLYVTLYDQNGLKIEEKLYYASRGFADGNFKIPENLQSGNYTLMASTAHQENFLEDEKFYQKIFVKNLSEEKLIPDTELEPQFDIQILPEGGHLVESISNICGVKIVDIKGSGVKNVSCQLFSSSSKKPLTKFKLNDFGMGKFTFYPSSNETYYILSKIGKKEFKTVISKAKKTGILIQSSLHSTMPMLIIELSTNKPTINAVKNKNLYILIHQYHKTKALVTSFTDQSQTLKMVIPLKDLPYGTNTVTLFDHNYNPISERLVFNHYNERIFYSEFIKNITSNDSITTSLRITPQKKDLDSINLSVSILPIGTISNNRHSSIISSIYLEPFLKSRIENAKYYFQNIDKRKKFDLDLLLLTQGWSKYEWNHILNERNSLYVNHEYGLTLNGAINTIDTENSMLYVSSQKNGLRDIISAEKEKPLKNFSLQNLFLLDSSKIDFVLVNKKGLTKKANIKTSLISHRTKELSKKACEVATLYNYSNYLINNFDLKKDDSFFDSSEKLDTVMIKTSYYNQPDYWASQFKAYIPEHMKTSGNVLSYLRTKRFQIVRNNYSSFGTSKIYTLSYDEIFYKESVRGSLTYRFMVNGISQPPSMARSILLKDVKALYIFGDIGTSSPQLISVSWIPPGNKSDHTDSYYTKGGFQVKKQFYTPKYESFESIFFNKYGAIGWVPNITIKGNQEFEIKYKNTGKEEVLFLIEGIDNKGNLISEIKNIKTINENY